MNPQPSRSTVDEGLEEVGVHKEDLECDVVTQNSADPQSEGRVSAAPLYHSMAETRDTRHAREVTELQSQSKYTEESRRSLSACVYSQLPETPETRFARALTELQSDVQYKADGLKRESGTFYSLLPETLETQHARDATTLQSQTQYTEQAKRESAHTLYSLLPETRDTQHARRLTLLYSQKSRITPDVQTSLYTQMPQTMETLIAKEVSKHQSNTLYKEKFNSEKGLASYTQMKELPDVTHAVQVNKQQSDVAYRSGLKDLHNYTAVTDRLDISSAAHASKLSSQVQYKSGRTGQFDQWTLMQRPDILQARAASDLASQVKYRQKVRGQRSQYDPKECVTFKHTQAAAALASQVNYSQKKTDTVTDLPNLLQLGHALHASKLQSHVEYRRKHRESVGRHHFTLDTAEQRHHKENTLLQSQVRYRAKYENNKSHTHLEPLETPWYRVCKEAQKMQSKNYCGEFLQLKGSDVTDTPEIQRVRNNQRNISSVQYRVSVGAGTAVTDTPEMDRVRRNQANISTMKYKTTLDPVSLGVTPDMNRVRQNQQNISSVQYRRGLQEVRGHPCLEVDTPEIRRVRKSQESISTVKYREEFERERCRGDTRACLRGDGGRGELHVWRTDPGSIFDFDPLEDNVQSRSLSRMSERVRGPSPQSSVQTLDLWSVCSSASAPQDLSSPGRGSCLQQHQVSESRGPAGRRPCVRAPVYLALYDYTAQDEDEVSFQDGDVFENTHRIDAGWMFGTVQRTGRSGMIPANYLLTRPSPHPPLAHSPRL